MSEQPEHWNGKRLSQKFVNLIYSSFNYSIQETKSSSLLNKKSYSLEIICSLRQCLLMKQNSKEKLSLQKFSKKLINLYGNQLMKWHSWPQYVRVSLSNLCIENQSRCVSILIRAQLSQEESHIISKHSSQPYRKIQFQKWVLFSILSISYPKPKILKSSSRCWLKDIEDYVW